MADVKLNSYKNGGNTIIPLSKTSAIPYPNKPVESIIIEYALSFPLTISLYFNSLSGVPRPKNRRVFKRGTPVDNLLIYFS
jgi:hypothetical protein